MTCRALNKGMAMLTAVVLLAAGVLPGLVSGADWPNWRGPSFNGISSETEWQAEWPASGPKVEWKKEIGTGFSSITVSNGRVYTMGNTGKKVSGEPQKDVVFCLEAQTGKEIWTHSYPCDLNPKNYEGGPNATPTIDGDTVFTFSKKGHLFSLDAATGKVNWELNLTREPGIKLPTWDLASSVLVYGKLIIVNAGTSGVALDKETGKIVWQNGTDQAGYATPVPCQIDGKECVAMFNKNSLVGVSPSTGKTIWSYPWKTQYDVNAADPVIIGDTIFISSGYNRGCSLVKVQNDKASALWENKEMRNHFNSSVFWKGYLYGFDESTLKCLDYKTGKEMWGQEGLGKGSLMMCADGKMIILSERGKLVTAQATPEKYQQISEAQVLTFKCWTAPVLANGRIYARNATKTSGTLVCVDVSK